MKKRLWTPEMQASLDLAVAKLRSALDDLKQADCPKTIAKVRLAISSAKGAQRNMGYRETRHYYEQRKLEGTA